MRSYKHRLTCRLFCLALLPVCLLITGCEKLIEIPEPSYSITTAKVFNSDKQATSAMAGIYTIMINGYSNSMTENSAAAGFSTGLSTIVGGLASDELFAAVSTGDDYFYSSNRLEARVAIHGISFWRSAYDCIYGANAILEGIGASTSSLLTDSTRKQLTGESKFIRAFCYFYLVNLFGDVPLAMTTDFNQTSMMSRTPKDLVYKQIISDLKDARNLLAGNYQISRGERVRVNKWAAAALLARVYLYTRDYENAAIQATDVIANNDLYTLVDDLNSVFLASSSEAIWQLKQNSNVANLGNATPEGAFLLANPIHSGGLSYALSSQLLNAFEPDDERKTAWVSTTDQSYPSGISHGIASFPSKYKTGLHNYSFGDPPTEYYMVLRLAEQYLIRAEAQANGAAGGVASAIADLDIVRHRAGLDPLPDNLSQSDLHSAIAKEWQVEFFCEWGHRWFNLKRTGKAVEVLSAIPYKQPWVGDHQLLHPIPIEEILKDNNLKQNPGY